MTKKLVVFLLIIMTPFIVFGDLKGDIDGDGIVGSNDYIKLRKHIIKSSELQGEELARADVNGDNVVNSADYIFIRNIMLNRNTSNTQNNINPGTDTSNTQNSVNQRTDTSNTQNSVNQGTDTSNIQNNSTNQGNNNSNAQSNSTNPGTNTSNTHNNSTNSQNDNTNIPNNYSNSQNNGGKISNGKDPLSAEPTPVVTPRLSAELICEKVNKEETISYEMFKSLQEDGDDFFVIKAAHDCANKYSKKVVVPKGEYHIYKDDGSGYIDVKTSTNLNNSKIYIHDEILEPNYIYNNDDSLKEVRVTPNKSIFRILTNSEDNCKKIGVKNIQSIDSIVKKVTSSPDDSEIKGLGFANAYVQVIAKEKNNIDGKVDNESLKKRVFKRSKNGNTGEAKSDAFRIIDGQIADEFFWNKEEYTGEIGSVFVCKIYKTQLVFKNATFITIVANNDELAKSKMEVSRNIIVSRSNTRLHKIKHYYIYSDGTFADNINYHYKGFYEFNQAANIEFTDSIVYGLNSSIESETGAETYDLNIKNVVGMTLNGIKMYDIDNQLKENLWGVTGTNGSKNIVFTNCKLNRIDAHAGIMNLTVQNSTIGRYGVRVTGAGYTKNNSLIMENVTSNNNGVYYLVSLRGDYGSTWNGKITIKNCNLKVKKGATEAYLIHWNAKLVDGNILHNYGYDLYLPDIEVDGLNIVNDSVDDFYIFNKSENFFKSLSIRDSKATDGKFKTYYNPTIKYKNITKGKNKDQEITVGKYKPD